MSERVYIAGETARFDIPDAGYEAATLKCGALVVAMTKAGDVWTASVDTTAQSGRVNWAVFAGGSAVAHGSYFIRCLVSPYRAVVTAIDAAMRKVGANGKYTVSVGEISLTDKTFEEMQRFRAYYQALADGEEAGAAPDLSPWRTTGAYE